MAGPVVNPSLFLELGRVFTASVRAIECAVSHGQVTVDFLVIKMKDDRRWKATQLSGRMARLNGREARLFGAMRRDSQL